MKLIRVMRAVFCEPWLIRSEVHEQISRIVQAHVDGTAHADAIMEGMQNGAELMPDMKDGVAVIPVDGIIGKRVSALEKSSGVVDCDDLMAMLDWAEKDEMVKGVVMDFHTPGGTVTGTPEVAKAIDRLTKSKPVIGYTDDQCCSAGYWLMSQCDAIYAAESASVGSVGVYMPFLDQSRAAEMAGLKMEVIKAGKLKGIGIPGTSLSDEQRAYLQARVDKIHSMFKKAVTSKRQVDDEAMQGQDFMGIEAQHNGMVDSIATLEDAIRDASQLASRRRK